MSENLTDIVARARGLFEIGDFSGMERTLQAAHFEESPKDGHAHAPEHARAEAQKMYAALRPDPVAIGAFTLTAVVMIVLLLLYAS
jgi:hypothetical protein